MTTILIVDDEPQVTKSLGNIISRLGLNPLVTENGNEALELIKQNRPAMVFLDININGLKGIDVLREAKKFDPSIKIVMITGDVLEEMEEEALKNGALKLLKKPFTVADIQKTLLDCGLINK